MLLSAVVGLLLISRSCGENPAVQVVLTNKGLQYGRHVGAGLVQERLDLITFPEIHGSVHIGIFGNVDYTLTGITITKCDFPEPSVEFYEDVTGLKISISGLNVALSGEWRTHYGIIHDGGSFDMAVFNLDWILAVKLRQDADGHLSVTSVSCDALIGNVDVEFYGGASWIFQPFVHHFKEHILKGIEANICHSVVESIVDLDHLLQAMNVSFQFNEDLTLDLPLIAVSVVEASNLSLGLKGEFYSVKTHMEPPFVAQPFTMDQQPDYMLSVGLSEFTVNSASYGCFSAGLLQVLIDDSMIPPSSPLHLNTSSMGPFVPQLPEMFPGLLMTLRVYAREFPVFSFHSGAVKLGFPGAVKASAILPNTTQIPLFKLHVDVDLSGKAWTADGRMKGSVGLNNFTLTLESSEIGPFKTGPLEKVAKLAMQMIVLTKMNEELGKGFLLPRTKTSKLVNSVLSMEEGFISISSDVEVLLREKDWQWE
ncbi:bactericidal permeability-increasing protein [Aulostomus maculatus]